MHTNVRFRLNHTRFYAVEVAQLDIKEHFETTEAMSALSHFECLPGQGLVSERLVEVKFVRDTPSKVRKNRPDKFVANQLKTLWHSWQLRRKRTRPGDGAGLRRLGDERRGDR